MVFLSGYVVDGSFAPAVKNAYAGEDWSASWLIWVNISANVNDMLLQKSQHVKAQVWPYAYSQHGARAVHRTACWSSSTCWNDALNPKEGRGPRADVRPWSSQIPSCLHRQPQQGRGTVLTLPVPATSDCLESDENPYALLIIHCAKT